MPASLVFAIILLVVAVAAFLLRKRRTDSALFWTSAGAAGLFVVMLFIACFKQVGTKEEGVKLSFGKPAGRLSAGPHLTWPWIKVKEMDAAVQTDTFGDGKHACLKVRIANQQTACAPVSLQWRIRIVATDDLYQNYRSFDHVRDALVTRKLNVALNEALAGYNPLNLKAEPLPEISKRVTKIMRREVGTRIEVLSTLLPLLTFDEDTQTRINQLQQQVAQTRIARQQKLTNIQVSAANNALAKSVSASPNVLVSRCLETLAEMVKRDQAVPAGFSCWPSSSSFGGVVATTDAGSAKKK